MARHQLMGQQIGAQLCSALGLPPYTVGFTIRCHVGEPISVECAYYPDAAGAPAMTQALAQYALVERDAAPVSSSEQHAAGIVGFDAWMRERTEKEHAEFMRRTSTLR